jgi:hypothetical protein
MPNILCVLKVVEFFTKQLIIINVYIQIILF